MLGPVLPYRGLELAPGATRIVYHTHEGSGGDVWVADVVRGATSRLTFDPSRDASSPIWSPDATRIAFAARTESGWALYERRADGVGADQLLVEASSRIRPMAWAPDGRTLVYLKGSLAAPSSTPSAPTTSAAELWALSRGQREPTRLLAEREVGGAAISPDGRWIAYHSGESGRLEVYVRPFPGLDGKWQVSTAGGVWPRWRQDGTELFFFTRITEGRVMSAAVRAVGTALQSSPPVPLFDSGYVASARHVVAQPAWDHPYDVVNDGSQFVIIRDPAAGPNSASPITVVFNWPAALGR